MKYVVWGTGNLAVNFLFAHINEYFYRNPIAAFIDNDSRKQGRFFFGIEIISPEEIGNCCYDAILICCNSIDSITRQIREELDIQAPILTIEDTPYLMYDFYFNNLKIYDKKVVVVGNSSNKETNLDRAYIFREAEYLSIEKLEELQHKKYDYVLCTWPSEYKYLSSDRRYEVVEYKLIEKIVKTGGAARESILTSSVNGIFGSIDKNYSLGEENPDKKFLLIKPGVGIVGLGGVILQVVRNIVYARRNHMIPVIDMQSFKNSYIEYDEIGKVNGWEKFFLQPTQWRVSDIQKSRNIVESMSKRHCEDITEERIENLLKAQPELKKKTDTYCNAHFNDTKRILGVLVRGSDYVNMKPFDHCIQPTIEAVMKAAIEKFNSGGYDLIYLCTEEQAIVDRFSEQFAEKIFYYPAVRVNSGLNGYLSESRLYKENNLYQIGSDYWVELYALSKCNALVAGNCSGTQVALMLNEGRYEDVYIFELGRYGTDDIEADLRVRLS